MKKVQMHRNLYVYEDITNLKVRAGYKKYNDYNKNIVRRTFLAHLQNLIINPDLITV